LTTSGITVAISQPTFLPWLGYFNLIASADVFVLLDTVQFEKQSWQSRNRVRTTQGDVQWLSVPVSNQPLSTPIQTIHIAPSPPGWRRKQLKTLEQHLRRTPFFEETETLYKTVLGESATHTFLADLNIEFIQATSQMLGIDTHLVRCSDLPVDGKRADFLLNICQHFGATTYLSNAGSAVYLEASRSDFSAAGVNILYQDWPHPEYSQNGPGFVSHLSCVDAIACMGGIKASAAVKRSA
jgi:hypothetical protein